MIILNILEISKLWDRIQNFEDRMLTSGNIRDTKLESDICFEGTL